MNVITNKISIDLLTESDQSPVVYAVQGECNTRAVELSLFCGGSPWQIPADALLAVRYGRGGWTGGYYDTLPDGTSAYSVTGNTITMILAPQMMTSAGTVLTQVEMTHGNQVLATFAFRLMVAVNPAVGIVEPEDYVNWNQWLEQKLDAYIDKVKESGSLLGGTMAGPIHMNGERITGLPIPREGTEASSKDYTDSVTKMAAHRNLLDNTDFRNPVNQRGFSEAYDDCFCIDRWKMGASTGQGDVLAVRLLDGCLQLNAGKGELDLEQTIPNHDSLVGKRCTVAVNLEGTVYCGAFSFGQQAGPLYFGDTKLKFYSVAGRSAIFRITSDVDVRYNLYWVAIYEGEYTINTLPEYQPKGYGAELAECMRYYYRNWSGEMGEHTVQGVYVPMDSRSVSISFPVPMIDTPEIILYNPVTKHSGCVADWATDVDIAAGPIYTSRHCFMIGGEVTGGKMIACNYEAFAEL